MSITGELITETFEYDGGREVTVYVPPEPPEAVVFAGDGQLILQWGGVLEAADVPPTMIVGAHRLADETLRLHDYSLGFDPERFAMHERFFVEDVRRWGVNAFRSRAARRPYRGVRCLGKRRTRARHRAPTSRCRGCDLLRLTGRG